MLRKGFLGAVSDYVAEATARHPVAFERAREEFGLHNLKNSIDISADTDKVAGLFSEWLVFDYKQKIFDDATGLEYFVKNNPLNFSDEDIVSYKQLLSFEVGLFEVKEVERGRGTILESIQSQKQNFVFDINASLSLKPSDTIWARVAPVNENFYIVSSSIFVVPFKIMPGLKKVISTWTKNSFDAKGIVTWLPSFRKDGFDRKNSQHEKGILTYEILEKKFEEALQKCGMNKMFTPAIYRKWVLNEKKYGTNFAGRAVYALTPTDADDKDASLLIDACMEIANYIPRKFLNGKTPLEEHLEEERTGQNLEDKTVEFDFYSTDKYFEGFEKASHLMSRGDFQESYDAFEKIIKDLFLDRMPLFDSFRVYANAAVCCFHKDDFPLGKELLEAALRLNPLYDFAIRTKERYPSPYDDYSHVRKGYKKIAKSLYRIAMDDGVRRYRRTAFRKYENFLKEAKISLEYKTVTQIKSYTFEGGKAVKIGRNDPCWCGAKKSDGTSIKFKRCHGK